MSRFVRFAAVLLLCSLCSSQDDVSGSARMRVEGKVRRAVTHTAIRSGVAEVRWPGHDDTFKPLRCDLGSDGTFTVSIPVDRLPDHIGDLTVSIIAEGFSIVEKTLPFEPGAGVPESVAVNFTLQASTLDGVLDIFSCCILSWGVITVMLPAFLLGAAITAFVPSHALLKYLGPKAPKPVAYGAAISSGMVLSLCSCNVVPLFVGIWRSGAGVGPAFAFLYAGPAINLVATAFTCRVIGVGMGVFRVGAVAAISLLVGLTMNLIFARKRAAQGRLATPTMANLGPSTKVTTVIIVALLYLLVIGSLEVGLWLRLTLVSPAFAALLFCIMGKLDHDQRLLWWRETKQLLIMVLPILLPAVLIIGFMAQHVPLQATRWLSGTNGLGQNFASALFGSLMYFPILTETAFVKAMLKVIGLGPGPAMALLLTAPGLSLPGMVIIYREIGWRRLLAYVGTIVVLATVTGLAFGSKWGQYICSCHF